MNTDYTVPLLELIYCESEKGFATSGETTLEDGGEIASPWEIY